MKLPHIKSRIHIKTALNKIYLALKGFRRVFPPSEKIAIFALSLIAFFSVAFWVNDARSQGIDGPNMTYSEGWLVEDGSIPPKLGRLTDAGLTRYLKDGTIGPDIADKWEESDDHKTYKFFINSRYSASMLLPNIKQNNEVFGGAEVSTPDEKTIVFKLGQPYNFFLAAATTPIFPFGPYIVESQTPQNITLVRRNDYHLGKPKINRIVLRLYQNEKDLKNALETKKVLATADLTKDVSGMRVQRIALPRYISVFFNTRRPPFDSRDLREKVVKGENVADRKLKVKLVSTTSPEVAQELDGVVNKLKSQGIELTVDSQDTASLVSNVLAKRDFDLLLFGIDYGYGEDLYPFWHSSRTNSPGSNFTGLQNKELDWKVEEIRTTANLEERATKIKEAKDIIKNEYVEIPVKAKVVLYQSSPRVSGNDLKYLADPLDRFNYISDWTVN